MEAKRTHLTHRKIDLIIEKILYVMEKNNIPGLSVYTLSGNKRFIKNYGVQNVDNGIPISNDSIWTYQSISKNISATTTAWLVNNNKTTFDQKVNPVLHLELANDYVTKNVTVRNGLSHTTGLPTQSGEDALLYNYQLEFIYKLAKFFPLTGFNKTFTYANLGFTLGFNTASKDSGYDKMETPIREFIKLIGMKDASVTEVPIINDEVFVYPHLPVDGKQTVKKPITSDPFIPSSCVRGTIEDLGKFISFHVKKGKGIIGEDILDQIYIPEVPIIKKVDRIVNGDAYGMGTSIYNYDIDGKIHILYGHAGGYSEGYTHQMLYDIKNDIGIAILTNTFDASAAALAGYIYVLLMSNAEFAEETYEKIYLEQSGVLTAFECNECVGNTLYNTTSFKKRDLIGKYFTTQGGYTKIYKSNDDYIIKVGKLEESLIRFGKKNIHFKLSTNIQDTIAVINPTVTLEGKIIGLELIYSCQVETYSKI